MGGPADYADDVGRPSTLSGGRGAIKVRQQGVQGTSEDPGVLQKIGYLKDAVASMSENYVLSAIKRHTTEDFLEIIKGIVPGLIIAFGAVIVSAAIGAGIGAMFFGVGAAPGAAIGGIIGTKVAVALLGYLGLGFLAYYVVEHIGEAGQYFAHGVWLAWNSAGSRVKIVTAGREFAEGIGVLFSLIIQAMLAFLLRNGGKGMSKLRDSKFFKWCPKVDVWLNENFLRLCFRYKFKPGIPVIQGGRIGVAQFQSSLVLARGLVGEMMSGQTPRFKSFRELHNYLTTQKGMNLVRDPKQTMVYGPKDPKTGKFIKDGAQAIYSSSDGMVIVKVKTRGYDWGGRPHGTMSVEITDGGSGWKNVLGKLTREGQLISKTRLAKEDVVALNDGVYAVTRGARAKLEKGARLEDLSRGGFGKDLRKVVEFELVEGGGITPMSQDAFANKGHIDFSADFKPDGAWELLQLTPPK